MQDKMQWQEKAAAESPALLGLEQAWRQWAAHDDLPLRASFDPMDFPDLLPWMLLAEIVAPPANGTIPYDMLFRYVGREFALYFSAETLTRKVLSEVGPPYTERWFAVFDATRQALAPLHFKGAPLRTAYDYVALEMLTLPFARIPGEIGFMLCAFARVEMA